MQKNIVSTLKHCFTWHRDIILHLPDCLSGHINTLVNQSLEWLDRIVFYHSDDCTVLEALTSLSAL